MQEVRQEADASHELARSNQREAGCLSQQSLHHRHADHGDRDPREPGWGLTEAEILSSYPTLNSEDIRAAIYYASDLASGRVVTLPEAG